MGHRSVDCGDKKSAGVHLLPRLTEDDSIIRILEIFRDTLSSKAHLIGSWLRIIKLPFREM